MASTCKYCQHMYTENGKMSFSEGLTGLLATGINIWKDKGTNMLKRKADHYSKCPSCGGYHCVCPYCDNIIPTSPGSSGEELVCDACEKRFVLLI